MGSLSKDLRSFKSIVNFSSIVNSFFFSWLFWTSHHCPPRTSFHGCKPSQPPVHHVKLLHLFCSARGKKVLHEPSNSAARETSKGVPPPLKLLVTSLHSQESLERRSGTTLAVGVQMFHYRAKVSRNEFFPHHRREDASAQSMAWGGWNGVALMPLIGLTIKWFTRLHSKLRQSLGNTLVDVCKKVVSFRVLQCCLGTSRRRAWFVVPKLSNFDGTVEEINGLQFMTPVRFDLYLSERLSGIGPKEMKWAASFFGIDFAKNRFYSYCFWNWWVGS